MLTQYLEKALGAGCDRIEIERKDGLEWIFAYHGPLGMGIGSLEPAAAKPLFEEVDALKKQKLVTICGGTYRARISTYESFGDWIYRIDLKPATKPRPSGSASPAKPKRRN